MAVWPEEQRIRLAWEESVLRDEFPHFSFQDRTQAGLTTVRGLHQTSASNTYGVCLWLKNGYPHTMPSLYITSPCPLYGYGYKSIQSYGTSHYMHVWEPDWNNYVKICHCKSEYWTASNNIAGVLMKAFLWLEAFEVHRRTGSNIDSYSLTY
jgi:hypothetical protein